jgi:hypothetical protein
MTKKPRDLHRHAAKRVAERYGMVVTGKDLEDMEAQIREGKSEYLGAESLNISRHVVTHKEVQIIVLYNRKLHTICTALPGEGDAQEIALFV